MLFSKSVKSYKCSNCDKTLSAETPTSVIPILVVFIISAVIWAGNISEFFKLESGGRLVAIFVGFIVAFGIFFLVFVCLQKIFSGWEKDNKCPRCGEKLESTGGGFIDGGIPGLQEILIYIIVIALPGGLALLMRS